jgi:streptogramin lyase
MSLRRSFFPFCALFSLLSVSLAGQTPTPTPGPTTVASATTWTTENNRSVTGVNLQVRPDGSVWFLVPSNDRIVQLQPDGVTLKQWQIRDDKNLGANPVDFVVEGDVVWFLENGESLINAGFSALGRLDTTSGELREWVIPGSRPAGFYRAPDGKVWIPETNGRLQSVDLASLEVVDYRSTKTFAYTDLAVGSDGALWMADFGNNRIVRYVPGSDKETSWTFFDPTLGRLNPSQIQFDADGALWISEFSANRMDRFTPATNELASFGGFLAPIHFDISGGRIYVAEAPGVNGRVVALDPKFAGVTLATLTPETLDVGIIVNKRAATIRDSTAIVTTFTSTRADAAAADVKVTSGAPGLLRTEFPVVNAFGISVSPDGVWVGSAGKLVRVLLQTIGDSGDLTVPVAAQFGVDPGPRILIETTLFNAGTAPLTGDALYLFSPASFAPRTTFTVAPGETVVLSDTFHGASSNTSVTFGPVRLRVTAGNAGDLAASVRTLRLQDDGSSYGFSIPALSSAKGLVAGTSGTLFLGARPSEIAIFGLYAAGPADATATLVAPDGTVRGIRRFRLAPNAALEFNPAASAFGAAPESGDTIRVAVASGTVQPYVNVFDPGSGDTAVSLPVRGDSGVSGVLPLVSQTGAGTMTSVTDLFLANSDATRQANVTISFFAAGAPVPPTRLANVVVPAGGSLAIADALAVLFPGGAEGAMTFASDAPLAVSARLASRRPEGDYAGFERAHSIGSDAILPARPAFSVGAPQTDTRQTDLILFNAGEQHAAGSVRVTAYDAAGNTTGQATFRVAPGQVLRVPAVVTAVGGAGGPAGRIVVNSDILVYAVTEQIDLATGDVEIAPLLSSP